MPQVLTVYLYESSIFLLPNDCLICLELEAKKYIYDISYNLYQWKPYAGGGGGGGAFSEWGMFENVLYRSEDVPVLTMYHCGSIIFYQQMNISHV